MARNCQRFASIFREIQAVRPGPSRPFVARAKATVLLLCLAACRTPVAQGKDAGDPRVFEFRCEFWMPIALGRVDGLMASEGPRHRLAIYWMEPALFREAPSFLRCCDLIVDRDVVHYWIQGVARSGTFRLSASEKGPLLPGERSPESILRAALAIVSQIRCPPDVTEVPLEVAAFFERSRWETQHQYEVPPVEPGPRSPSNGNVSSAQVLNALPFGREYSKETRTDGCVVWRARKALNGLPVTTVTIHPVHEGERQGLRTAFNEQTLGQWGLIPEAYRTYWSFDRALAEVSVSSESRTAGRDLYDELNSYLDQNKAPPEVSRALDRLRFKAALLTGDSNCVWQAARAVVTRLCEDDNVPKYQCLVDMGSLSGQIQKRYPERLEEELRPLVARVVRHAGQEGGRALDRLMRDITNNGWFTYGELLLAQMRQDGLIEDRDADPRMAKLKTSRAAKGTATSDSSDSPPGVRQYLSQLDAAPPRGPLDVNEVRRTLNEGLAQRFTAEQAEAKEAMVESTIRSIRLIAGEGPFRGEPAKLTVAIDRFSRNCLHQQDAAGSFETVLATFLALSFCDTSTAEDHERLFSQLQHCSRDLQSRVNAMLAACGLTALVTPEEVERAFQTYERLFQQYLDDPLWPPFKFPWTHDEEGRLAGALRLRLMQLEPVFEEISLKVKYGGASPELKDKTVRAISAAAQELLPQAAVLRLPPYPGVSCHYRKGYGCWVGIQGPLYQEDGRPKERFRAMKYFHLGRRLEELVIRERELARPSQRQETSHEAATSKQIELPSRSH